MAGLLNPQDAPTNDPNYLRYAHVVEAPSPNVSTKIGLETAAAGLDTSLTAVDTSIKKGIQDATYKAVDPIRDAWTAGLEQTKASLDSGVIPAPVQGAAGTKVSDGKGSLFDANASMDDTELPAGLESGLDRIRSLAEAKAAGSPRLNDTQYAKDTLSVAKQLRSTYGVGYRDYIDSEVSKASGLPVANSYAQNLLQDINHQLSQVKTAKDDVLTTAMKNLDIPGMTDPTGKGNGYLDRYKRGDPDMPATKLLGIIGDHQAQESTLKLNALKAAEKDRQTDQGIKDGTKTLTTDLNNEVLLRTSGIVESSG
jgi:hypothetical protein